MIDPDGAQGERGSGRGGVTVSGGVRIPGVGYQGGREGGDCVPIPPPPPPLCPIQMLLLLQADISCSVHVEQCMVDLRETQMVMLEKAIYGEGLEGGGDDARGWGGGGGGGGWTCWEMDWEVGGGWRGPR